MKKITFTLLIFLTVAFAFACKDKGKEGHSGHEGHGEKTEGHAAHASEAGPWVRKMLKGNNTAGFMVIKNDSDKEDVLVAVETDTCEKVELHEMAMEGDKMVMREKKEGFQIPAQGSIELKPGGLHIMLLNLKETLEEGKTVSLKLKFKSGREETVEAPVKEKVGGMDHSGHSGH